MLVTAITFTTGLSDEKTNSIKTPNHSITPNLNYYGTKIRVEFTGSYFEHDSVTFDHGKLWTFTLHMRYVKQLTSAIIRH